MTIQQLQYIVAIDRHRHFARAAESCFVTQPTLSSMVRKLERELDLVIFDRRRSPVEPTPEGKHILAQARMVLREVEILRDMATDSNAALSGRLHVGVIPTVAPYLLPLFLGDLLQTHPGLELRVEELTTRQILERLQRGELDVGILATPLDATGMEETPLYNERFMLYASPHMGLPPKGSVDPDHIDTDQLWVLREDYCLRGQVADLCGSTDGWRNEGRFLYASGSIEGLLRMVDAQGGLTVVPELATLGMGKEQRAMLREFTEPVPVRRISLLTHRHFGRPKLVQPLVAAIQAGVGPHVGGTGPQRVLPVKHI